MKKYAIISLVCAAFVTLIMLGTWQVQRMHWKADILDAVSNAQTLPAVEFPAEDALNDEWEYRRVELTGTFIPYNDFKLLSRIHKGDIGFHVLEPFKLKDGRHVLVNRGFVPNAYKGDYKTPVGEMTITGSLHVPDDKNMFTPENPKDSSDMYWTDLTHISNLTAIDFSTDMVVFEDDIQGDDPLIGGQLRIDIPNNHKKYAFFWYTMALILAIMVFIVFLKQKKQGARGA